MARRPVSYTHLKTDHHQGIAASIDEYKTYSVDEILKAVPAGKTPLLVMLDGLEDPHNLGAILRTCDCVGADGVIIGKHRSVQLTPTVAKVSTGAIDTVKVAVVTNLVQTIKDLKEKGFWAVGADAHDAKDYREGQYDVPLLLVIGSEGFGTVSYTHLDVYKRQQHLKTSISYLNKLEKVKGRNNTWRLILFRSSF